MNTDELFVSSSNLPKPLDKKELYELLSKISDGNKEARDKVLLHNIRLVLYRVNERFGTVQYDRKYLVSLGIDGLIKAINNYDISKSVEFSTFAIRCIDNEILMFLGKLRRSRIVGSTDLYMNTLNYEDDIEEEYIDNELRLIVNELVMKLSDREREIIMMFFGFYDGVRYKQGEIADKFNVSQSFVSRVIKGALKKIRMQLMELGIIEDGKLKEKKKRCLNN